MDVREKLVELVENGHGYYYTEEYKGANVYAAIADHLIAHGVTVQEWISVKDRLPETTRLCIASKYNVPFLAWWTGKDWREANTVTVVNGINYWMELPQPPKGE